MGRKEVQKMARWVNADPCSVIAYFDRLFEWGDPILARGGNILVHCLAGAHRAGQPSSVFGFPSRPIAKRNVRLTTA